MFAKNKLKNEIHLQLFASFHENLSLQIPYTQIALYGLLLVFVHFS